MYESWDSYGFVSPTVSMFEVKFYSSLAGCALIRVCSK